MNILYSLKQFFLCLYPKSLKMIIESIIKYVETRIFLIKEGQSEILFRNENSLLKHNIFKTIIIFIKASKK